MKQLIRFTLGFLIAAGLVYLFFSIMETTFNCFSWPVSSRGIFCIVASICGTFLGIVASDP